MGFFLGPIIMLAVSIFMVVAILISLVGSIGNKTIAYDEETFHTYADEQYQAAFGEESAYEDKMLIVFAAYDERDEYDCIAWVGDHLHRSIRNMMGDENTTFGRIMLDSVNNANYTYSLGQNLADAVDELSLEIQSKITSGAVSSVFTCKEAVHAEGTSHVVNKTNLELSDLLDEALVRFTDDTGIEMVIVIDEASEVFGYESPVAGIIALIFLLCMIGFSIYLIVRASKQKKNGGNGGNGANINGGNGSGTTFNGNPSTDNSSGYGDNW